MSRARQAWRLSKRWSGAHWWNVLETADGVAFTLQSVVLEYVTDRLVEEVADEITRGQPDLLIERPLIRAQAKDYLRQTQERLIGEPILLRLQAASGPAAIEQRLQSLLDGWRDRPRRLTDTAREMSST